MCQYTTRLLLLKGCISYPQCTFRSRGNLRYMISKSSSNFVILRFRWGCCLSNVATLIYNKPEQFPSQGPVETWVWIHVLQGTARQAELRTHLPRAYKSDLVRSSYSGQCSHYIPHRGAPIHDCPVCCHWVTSAYLLASLPLSLLCALLGNWANGLQRRAAWGSFNKVTHASAWLTEIIS